MGIRESLPYAWQTLPELSLLVQMQTAGESPLARQKVLLSDHYVCQELPFLLAIVIWALLMDQGNY